MKRFRKLFFTFFYLGNPPWDTNQSPPELLDFIDQHPPGRALDLGCGTGTNVITLAQKGWQAIGVDFVAKPIRIARNKAQKTGIQATFYVDDVTKLNAINNQFDLILDMGCYHSLTPAGRRGYQRNIERLLSPGGTFLLYVFFKTNPESTGTGLLEIDLEQFQTQLELIKRQNGSERGLRRAAWLTFRKAVS
jgi:cyclopropane fatty-acyl-phospholipid synthase-like methyltransferase